MEVIKEAFQLSKGRYESLELDHKTHKSESDRLHEENAGLNKRVHEMAGQMMELRNLLQAVKEENDRLHNSYQQTSEVSEEIVRRSSRGVVSWTCHPVLALGQRFDSHFDVYSAVIALDKGLTVLYLVFSNGT